jgi:hypothetical protein
MMAAATSMVAATITGPRLFGRMCRTTWRDVLAPRARAASTNSFSRRLKNWARTSRATGIQRKPPMTATIRMKMPSSRPNNLLERLAEQEDQQEQQRQLRQAEEQVGDPHQRGVDPAAGHARDGADHHADRERHQHRGQPHRQRDASTVQHACQEVASEVVGAHQVLPVPGSARRALKSMSLMPTL